MERGFEKSIGTALVAIGVALLLFGFYQAYTYTQSPPSGSYTIFTLGGGGGSGSSGSVNASFNGRFVEAFTFLGIEYLVGAAILKAGWNLITPKAETLQVRVKPRSLQVEPVGAPPPPFVAPPPPDASYGPAPPTT